LRWEEVRHICATAEGKAAQPALPNLFPQGDSEETATSTLGAELGYCVNGGGIKKRRMQFHRKPAFLNCFMSCRTNQKLQASLLDVVLPTQKRFPVNQM